MIITPAHLLDTAKLAIIDGGGAMPVRRCLVIHFTSGMTAQSSIDYWRSRGDGVCAHLIIDRDGTIFQCRRFDRTAGHAGVSRWRDPAGVVRRGVNAFGIGIEMANAGDSVSANGKAFGKYDCPAGFLKAQHKNGGTESLWEHYPAAQLLACWEVSALLVARYHLDDLVGHEDIAPERKNDPGPAFPMADLRAHCGFAGLPHVNRL